MVNKTYWLYFLIAACLFILNACSNKINNNLFYGGYTNTKHGHSCLYFSNGIKSVHTGYYNVSLEEGEIVRKNRIDDHMRNNKQFFDRKGRLVEFQSLDTLDRIFRKLTIKYDKSGRRVSQVYLNPHENELDSTIFTYLNKKILKGKINFYAGKPHVCGSDTNMIVTKFRAKGREMQERSYCRKEGIDSLLGRAYAFEFNSKGFLSKKSEITKDSLRLIEAYTYDDKGRRLELKSFNPNGKLGGYGVHEYFGDTLTILKRVKRDGSMIYSGKYVVSIDSMGNPIRTILYWGEKPMYIMEHEILYY